MSGRIKTLNLALQGGGFHGAFTWGALDRLLEEEHVHLEGVSGTSSGAMNAAILAQGLLNDGRDGAKAALETFWHGVGSTFAMMYAFPIYLPGWPMESSGGPMDTLLHFTRDLSPYQLNPLGHNPLRELLEKQVDFDALRTRSPVRLFISATEVRTGKLKIFATDEITIDVLLASACLPSLHHAVMVDGEPYWDGGFTGNPTVFPLIFNCRSPDVVVIIVQPFEARELPTTAEEIRQRTIELGFSSTFLREMRAIAFSKQQIGNDWLPGGQLERKLRRLNMHLIQDPGTATPLDPPGRGTSLPTLIQKLHARGRDAADAWLRESSRHVGSRSSIDLVAEFC